MLYELTQNFYLELWLQNKDVWSSGQNVCVMHELKLRVARAWVSINVLVKFTGNLPRQSRGANVNGEKRFDEGFEPA